MIEKKCFTKEWIDSFKSQKAHGSIQTPILEKMIHAFHLLELLKTHGLEFVFKGGTSLILLLEEGNRFSIDIDIICTAKREKLEKILQTIVDESNFTKCDLDEKRSYKEKGVPKAHYIFKFTSVCNEKIPGKLLLDILFEQSIYPEVIESPIKTKWIRTTKQIKVSTPNIDSITGDKLTAFAPNTIGIPYYKGEDSFSMEICKQLYDLSKLFRKIENMEIVKKSFDAFAKYEIDYRSHDDEFRTKKITPSKVLYDTIDTCKLIVMREKNREEPFKTQFVDIKKGIRSLGSNFLMSGKFRLEDAIIAAASVALLAAKILVEDLNPIEYYEGQDIKSMNVEELDWNFLNKLKKQPDKSAFFYWYKTVELLNTKIA